MACYSSPFNYVDASQVKINLIGPVDINQVRHLNQRMIKF